MKTTKTIGQKYKIRPFNRESYLAEYMGQFHIGGKPSDDLLVFRFDFYTMSPHRCFMLLNKGKHAVVGSSLEEMVDAFNRNINYVGRGYEFIQVGMTKMSKEEFLSQIQATTAKPERIQECLDTGRFSGGYGARGEIKMCPDCKTLRDTTCSACGCGSCVVCNHRWTCMPITPTPILIGVV